MPEPTPLAIDWTRMLLLLGPLAIGALALALSRRAKEGSRSLHLEERLRLGPRQQVLLVRVGGERLLLGATGESLALLKSLPSEEPVEPEPEEEVPEASGPGGFGQVLRALQGRAA